MTNYSHKASKFLRSALEFKPNRPNESQLRYEFLSKLEDAIGTMGQYIQQRHGMESYRDLLNAVCSDKEE